MWPGGIIERGTPLDSAQIKSTSTCLCRLNNALVCSSCDSFVETMGQGFEKTFLFSLLNFSFKSQEKEKFTVCACGFILVNLQVPAEC